MEFKPRNDNSSVTRKILINRDTYKTLKKMAIDFNIDIDDKITPEVLGECVNHSVAQNKDKENIIQKGIIKLFPNANNIIAIPVRNQNVSEYFIDRLNIAFLDGSKDVKVSDVISSAVWYDNEAGIHRNFIPDTTNPQSVHNFSLTGEDGQIRAFTVKTKSFDILNRDMIEFYWES